MELRLYTDDDLPLTEALETDPAVMRELGGPVPREEIPALHRRRLASVADDPWWLVIVPEPGGPAAGTIGVWEGEVDGARVHETGWMLLPAFHGRGIASAALALLIERARAEPRFTELHAFPGVSNGPSNGLCRKFGFTLRGELDGGYRGASFRINHWVLALRGPAPSGDTAAR
jgi:RimJ/RimL family protein N-acetyltransferase